MNKVINRLLNCNDTNDIINLRKSLKFSSFLPSDKKQTYRKIRKILVDISKMTPLKIGIFSSAETRKKMLYELKNIISSLVFDFVFPLKIYSEKELHKVEYLMKLMIESGYNIFTQNPENSDIFIDLIRDIIKTIIAIPDRLHYNDIRILNSPGFLTEVGNEYDATREVLIMFKIADDLAKDIKIQEIFSDMKKIILGNFKENPKNLNFFDAQIDILDDTHRVFINGILRLSDHYFSFNKFPLKSKTLTENFSMSYEKLSKIIKLLTSHGYKKSNLDIFFLLQYITEYDGLVNVEENKESIIWKTKETLRSLNSDFLLDYIHINLYTKHKIDYTGDEPKETFEKIQLI